VKKIHLIAGVLCMLFFSPAAFAYIGPGLGTGVVATVLGVLAGLLMLLVGVIWYPLKRLIKWLRTKKS
jgi:hypothetical protein